MVHRHPDFMRTAPTLAAGILLVVLLVAPIPVEAEGSVVRQIAEGKVKPAALNTGGIVRTLPGLSGGTLDAVVSSMASQPGAALPASFAPAAAVSEPAVSKMTLGCAKRTSDRDNRVNQDCTFRSQASALIKANPSDTNNLIAGFNDNRVGLNHCGFAYSLDGGDSWGDGQPPFLQHFNGPVAGHTIAGGPGTAHTYDSASHPGIAFDSAGRAFFGCIMTDLNTNATAVLVTQSPQEAKGSFYDNVPASGATFVVVEDNSPTVVHDREVVAADTFPSSSGVDNVYVTWSVFKFSPSCGAPPDGTLQFCSNAIFGSMSTDHAVTWSTPEEISGSSPLCSFGNLFDPSRDANACDLDGGSDTQVTPSGHLLVAINNNNTQTANSQQLAVVCHPSGHSEAGTAHLNCGSPSKIGDDVVVGAPLCNFGRGPEECVPGPFVRTHDVPRVAIDRVNGAAFTVWQDFRNSEFDIQLSTSTDDGLTWSSSRPVNPDSGFDHYFPAVGADSTNLAVSYYRAGQVPTERNGSAVFAPGQPGVQTTSSQYWLSGQQPANMALPFVALPISPTFGPPDGIQTGFIGDYTGLAVVGSTAHAIWSDTRNSVLQTSPAQGSTHDEDIFTTTHGVPD